jgi:hypothetical protein
MSGNGTHSNLRIVAAMFPFERAASEIARDANVYMHERSHEHPLMECLRLGGLTYLSSSVKVCFPKNGLIRQVTGVAPSALLSSTSSFGELL